MARELGLEQDGYRLVANNGANGGQIVFHFHVHIVSGKQTSRVGVASTNDRAVGAAGAGGADAARGRLTVGAQPARPRFYAKGTKQRAVRFAGSDGATLAGTLLLPIWSELEKVPGVVLVSGSGPTDRDGNNTLVPDRIDLLKQIAELLAEAGIASLRYDKRGIGASTARPHGSIAELERFFSWDNFVGDVVAAQAELVKHDEIKSYATALLGHSEGGLAGAGRGSRHHEEPAARHGARGHAGPEACRILRAQIGRGAPNLVAPAERAIAAIEATGHVPADLPRELARSSRPMPDRSCSACWRSIPRRRWRPRACPAWCCRAPPTARSCPWRTCSP